MRLNWRSEVTHIAGAAMEAAWLSAVLAALSRGFGGGGRALAGVPLFIVLYASRAIVRRLADARLDSGRSRTLLAYLVTGSLLVCLKLQDYGHWPLFSAAWPRQLVVDLTSLSAASVAPILTIATVAYAWRRGVSLAYEGVSPSSFMRQFEIGLLALLAVGFLAERAGIGERFTPWLFWFFFWGLLAIAAARLHDIARSRRAAVESYWLPIVLSVTILVLLGGGAVSLLYSADAVAAVQRLLAPLVRLIDLLYGALINLVLILVLPLAYLIELLMRLLVSRLGRRDEQQPMELAPGLDEMWGDMQRQSAGLPPALQEALRWLVTAAALTLLVWFLASSLRRRFATADGSVEEVRESVWSLADLLAGLRALWRRLCTRLSGALRAGGPRVALPATADERAAYSIRQIYRRLLALSASLGCPRPAASTPNEFLPSMAALLPAVAGDLHALTDVYVRARYGAAATGAEDLLAAQEAWQRVCTAADTVRTQRRR